VASAVVYVYHETGYTALDNIQVQTSPDGTTWTTRGTINRYDGSTGWKLHTVDLSALIGTGNFQIGYLGVSAYGNDCHLDDVSVTYTPTGSCVIAACTPAAAPKPVPDGQWVTGTPMKGTKLTGNNVHVTWDVSSCVSGDYNLYSGPLSAVSTYGYDTWTCNLGTTGGADGAISGTGAAQFFLVVPVQGTAEGSHGRNSAGTERAGSGVGHCSIASKDTTGMCTP